MRKHLIIFLLLRDFGLSYAQNPCANLYVERSSDGMYIYFSSNRGGQYDIYRSLADGSGLEQLTSTPEDEHYPAVSPDGLKITYQVKGYPNGDIWLMDADGGNPLVINDSSGHQGAPDWSPDGSKIVYEGWDESNYPEIFMMTADGSDPVQLTDEPGARWNSQPTFNPAGNRIYFQKGFNADDFLASMNTDGSDLDTITPPNSFGIGEFGLSFSEDGQRIIFSTTEYKGYDNGSDVIIANADGSGWTQITNGANGEYYYMPCFGKDTSEFLCSHTTNSSGGDWQIIEYNRTSDNWDPITNCWNVGFEQKELEWNIFPNPVQSDLYAELMGVDAVRSVELLSVTGVRHILSDYSFLQGVLKLDVGDLPGGLYYLSIETEKGEMIQPVYFVD